MAGTAREFGVIDREILDLLSKKAVSGVALAEQMGVSRSAVWKRIQHLRDDGFEIETSPGKGYFLKSPVEWLDREFICSHLNAEAKKMLGDFQVAEKMDSTNSWAKSSAKQKAGTDIFLAEQQTAGRGRMGRQWASPMAANIYLSLRRRFNKGLPALSGLSLVVGVILAKSLRGQGFSGIGLKWPNDIVATGNKKCGGILIEVSGEANAEISAVIGIGLNIRMPMHSAANIDQPWTDLQREAGAKNLSRNEILIELLNDLLTGLQYFEEKGPADFLVHWPDYDTLLNREVKLIDGQQTQTGKVLGITEQGALRLQQGSDERHYHSGEISARLL